MSYQLRQGGRNGAALSPLGELNRANGALAIWVVSCFVYKDEPTCASEDQASSDIE